MKRFSLLFISLLVGMVFCQPFTDMSADLQGVAYGASSWGDYDNDGQLDVIVTGSIGMSGIAKIFHNVSGVFTDISAPIGAVQYSSVEWGDYDNDGYLDLAVTGMGSSNPTSKIYRNEGGVGMFTDINAGLVNVSAGSTAWGDYDNDGDLDLFLSGAGDSMDPVSKLYKNDSGVFTEVSSGIIGVHSSDADWGDYDNDGDLDLLMTGYNGTYYETAKVYKNDSGVFTDISAGLTGVVDGSCSWGDFDNDGDPDILISGFGRSDIYSNEGSGTFTNINAGLQGMHSSDEAWGDYDNDGDLDIIAAGWDGSNLVTIVYRNDLNGIFTDINAGLTGTVYGSVSWGDYDSDGDLDILMPGDTGSGYITSVFRNNCVTPNSVPSTPADPALLVSPKNVLLSWSSSTDDTTPAAALTYNVYISSTEFSGDTKDPMSIISTGARKIVHTGNTGHKRSFSVEGLASGTYYWGVQAIDNCFGGSEFTAGEPFIFEGEFSDVDAGIGTFFGDFSSWGDHNGDGELDIIIVGQAGTKIFEGHSGEFYPLSATLPDLKNGSSAWGDYDNDGDLDVLLTGENPSESGEGILILFRNDSLGVFTEVVTSMPKTRDGAADWGDYDNDGDLDILLTGYGCDYLYSGAFTAVFQNNAGEFTDMNLPLSGLYNSTAEWADFNNDGYDDILITGQQSESSGYSTVIYVSNLIYPGHPETFSVISAGITGVSMGSTAAGDYDSDGDLDILLCGMGAGPGTAKIYNNDDMVFTESPALLQGTFDGKCSWGDYDNDGDLDILLNGLYYDGEMKFTTKIYRNDCDSFFDVFSDTGLSFEGIAGTSSWGDYDNDGDLDILLTGNNGAVQVSRIYRNNSDVQNTPPEPVVNLAHEIIDDYVHLSWNKSSDDETDTNGLTYNIYISKTSGKGDALDPMSIIQTGKRKIVHTGNAYMNNSLRISGLTGGDYYWGVQAIDNCYVGSEFLFEGIFHYEGDFCEVSTEMFPINSGSVTFGDFDNDSDLDFIAAGSGDAEVFVNEYQGIPENPYLPLNAGLQSLDYGTSSAWGDYDNDGDLDVLVTGYKSGGSINDYSIIYNNDGGVFTDINASLTGVRDGSCDWGDFDNDGDLDIVLCGYSGSLSDRITKVYRNDGGGIFTDTASPVTGVDTGCVRWGRKDSLADVLLSVTGYSSAGPVTEIWKYDMFTGVFAEMGTDMDGTLFSSSVWWDFDSDGISDFLYSGRDNDGTLITKLYHFDGTEFTDVEMMTPALNITDADMSSFFCGDYDNDGDSDLLMTGNTDPAALPGMNMVPVTKLFRNDHGITPYKFTAVQTGFENVCAGSTAMGDYDNDGDLDILISGTKSNNSGVTKIYKNNIETQNTPPVPPSMLDAMPCYSFVFLSWDQGSDTETSADGLTYNFYLGTSPGVYDIVNPMSADSTGYKKTVSIGNATDTRLVKVVGLAPGTYYWSVQSVDKGYSGSLFSPEGSFTMSGLGSPQNVTITVSGSDTTISWEAVSGATGYKIFATDDPYSDFIDITDEGGFNGNSWIRTGGETRLFYYVVSVADEK